MIKVQEIEISSDESNQSLSYVFLTPKLYQELAISHQLALDYINELAELKNASLPDSLSFYIKDRKIQEKSAGEIIPLMEARLNKMVKNNRTKKNWSKDDITILLWMMGKYMLKNNILSPQHLNKQDWAAISIMISGSSAHNCMFRFISLRKFKLAVHKWEKDQQFLLLEIINEVGDENWKLISEKLYERGLRKRIFRTPKQCRQHWSCYLNPEIRKGPWDKFQDKKLMQMIYSNQCIKKWSCIKKSFEGRTENALKNRYNLLLEKKRRNSNNRSLSQTELILEILQSLNEEKQQTKSQSKPKCGQDKLIPQNSSIVAEKLLSENGEEMIGNGDVERMQNDLVEDNEKNVQGNGSSSSLIPLIPSQKRDEILTYNSGFFYIFNPVSPYTPNVDENVPLITQLPLNNWFFKFGNSQ